MATVAISRLDQEVVRIGHRVRIEHQWIVIASQVARECDPRSFCDHVHAGCPQNVAGVTKHDRAILGYFEALSKGLGRKGFERANRVFPGVQWKRRAVLAEALAIGVARIGFQEIPAVWQENAAECTRGLSANDPAAESILYQ